MIGAGGSACAVSDRRAVAGKRPRSSEVAVRQGAHRDGRGGCAASMGNANPNDNWQVHFRDTTRGVAKFLNNWRMAELHARRPDRVWELETYGAVRPTADARSASGTSAGNTYHGLAHVGDHLA
ncbi:hypothetical protein HBB16_03395 [Pseudonocardia sp. MCCB 268]|nr:hypothetical protein [Pseudonocardia cytotoxica]